jgi:hypothetical protein
VAVLDFKAGEKVTPQQAAMLADLVRDELHRSGMDKYEILDRKLMKERLAEKDLVAAGEVEGPTSLVATGKSLGVQKIVGGQASAFGDLWVLTIQIVDVGTGRVDGTSTRKAGMVSGLLDSAPDAARDLLGMALRADELIRTERERQEKERREALKKLWEEQKKAIVTRFEKAPAPVSGVAGTYYRVEVENPTDSPAAKVLVELRGAKENETKIVRFKEVRARGKAHRTIQWDWKDKPRGCQVTSVGGDLNPPKAAQCSKCKGLGTILCRNCLGKGYKDCRKCRGTGVLVERYYESKGLYRIPVERQVTCPACEGSGKEACTLCENGQKLCPKCRGTGSNPPA